MLSPYLGTLDMDNMATQGNPRPKAVEVLGTSSKSMLANHREDLYSWEAGTIINK